MIRLFILPFAFFSFSGFCQNLVLNGSFEAFLECIDQYGEIEVAMGWYQQVGSSDYFNACCKKKNFVGVPKNFVGYQKPINGGSGYAGLFLYNFDRRYEKKGCFNREYLQTKLISPLKQSRYIISFYYSLSDSSEFFTDHFSIAFSKEKNLMKMGMFKEILTSQNYVAKKIAHAESIDTASWHKVEFDYVSNGGEEYLTIGLVKEDFLYKDFKRAVRKNRVIKNGKLQKSSSCYYYIDEVSVVEKQ